MASCSATVSIRASPVRDKPAVRDADGMRARRLPLATWVALAFLLSTATAVPVSLVVADRGPGCSFAGTDGAGRLALVGPVILCLVAAGALVWRHRDRSRAAALVSAAALAWLLA